MYAELPEKKSKKNKRKIWRRTEKSEMKNMEVIKKLVGDSITESNLKNVDCYVYENFALFIQ